MNDQTPQFYLSPGQQDLLMAALSSNQKSNQTRKSSRGATLAQPKQTLVKPQSPMAANASPSFDSTGQDEPGSGHLDFSPDESPYLDFDLDGDGDDAYDFDIKGNMIGDLPESGTGTDLHDKRKSIDGKDNDDEGGGKRREGEDKTGKKPGRKPLTSEPTSKRKAQNRAAQRAFRERKEKHLKDLETKVEDLEKASESANHENGLLRAQVERLQVELKEYRKRLSWASTNGLGRGSLLGSVGHSTQPANGNDFQFEFPKFGDLPASHIFGTNATTNGNSSKSLDRSSPRSATLPAKSSWGSQPTSQNIPGVLSRNSFSSSSPTATAPTYGSTGNSPMTNNFSASPVSQPLLSNQGDSNLDSLSGLFSPSIIEASRKASFDYFPQPSRLNPNNSKSRGSVDHSATNGVAGLYSTSSVSNTDSPSSSSDSHHQASSIGTSPEPSLSSPTNKMNEFGLNTINEENQIPNTFGGEKTFCDKLNLACGNATNPVPPIKLESNGARDVLGSGITPGIDPNGFNWLAQQNGGSFDPVLFGGYRDSQNAVLSQDFGTFFNDAFPLPDLGSPLHNYSEIAPLPAPKSDLIKQVDALQEGEEEVVPAEDTSKLMTCNKIWDRLQSMEKFRNGEIDVDNLCAELRSKARCSEGGAVVEEKDVEKILGKPDWK